MRALFITHSVGVSGAPKALQTLTRAYGAAQITLAIPKAFPFQKRNDLDRVRRDFGPHVTAVKEFYLPRHLCYEGSAGVGTKLKNIVRSAFWLVDRRRLEKDMKEGDYDLVHLNTVALNQLIRETPPCVLHVREVVNQVSPRLKHRVEKAKGVVFIDETTKGALRACRVARQVVLNDPVDMTEVDRCVPRAIAQEYGLDSQDQVVVSLVGHIHPLKGVDFVLRSFRRLDRPGITLLVVGDGPRAYVASCRQLAGHDRRIRFLGEERDIAKVYAVSDFVLRGDPTFRLGLTVLEGLYAGCDVIIPGTRDDIVTSRELERFWEKIHLYRPRDEASLIGVLEAVSERKVTKTRTGSNADKYAKEFGEFVRAMVRDR